MRALLLTLVLLPSAAFADCAPGNEIFSCKIGKNILEICDTGAALAYSFGKPGNPDLTLTEPIETVDFTPWPGIGGAIWENVTFYNKGYSYEVWTSIQRDPQDTSGRSGGVTVMNGEKTQATLTCDQGTASQSLDVIYDLKQRAGQCWNFETKAWAQSCT